MKISKKMLVVILVCVVLGMMFAMQAFAAGAAVQSDFSDGVAGVLFPIFYIPLK